KYDPISSRDYYSLSAFFNSIDENGMYDHPAKVPSPTLLLPTEQQEKQLAIAQDEVAKAAAALAKILETGGARYERWLAGSSQPVDSDLSAYFSFNGNLTRFRNEAAGKPGEGNAVGLPSVDGVRGRAIRFDGDHGAD